MPGCWEGRGTASASRGDCGDRPRPRTSERSLNACPRSLSAGSLSACPERSQGLECLSTGLVCLSTADARTGASACPERAKGRGVRPSTVQ